MTQRYTEEDYLQRVQLSKSQYKGYLKILQSCLLGLENSYNSPHSDGLASLFHVLEIAHTHFWAENDAQTPGSGLSSVLGTPISSAQASGSQLTQKGTTPTIKSVNENVSPVPFSITGPVSVQPSTSGGSEPTGTAFGPTSASTGTNGPSTSTEKDLVDFKTEKPNSNLILFDEYSEEKPEDHHKPPPPVPKRPSEDKSDKRPLPTPPMLPKRPSVSSAPHVPPPPLPKRPPPPPRRPSDSNEVTASPRRTSDAPSVPPPPLPSLARTSEVLKDAKEEGSKANGPENVTVNGSKGSGDTVVDSNGIKSSLTRMDTAETPKAPIDNFEPQKFTYAAAEVNDHLIKQANNQSSTSSTPTVTTDTNVPKPTALQNGSVKTANTNGNVKTGSVGNVEKPKSLFVAKAVSPSSSSSSTLEPTRHFLYHDVICKSIYILL